MKRCGVFSLRFVAGLVLVCGALLAAAPASAQEFPTRPIEVIVGFAPGGGTDLTARAVAIHGGRFIGQPFVVTNKAGASGTLASQYVAAAKPDGYTLLVAGGSETTAVPHFKKLPYHALEDFVPILCLVRQDIGISVRADSPWKTFEEFVADAKQNPGKYSYASSGVGGLYHAVTLALEKKAGISLRHVPFKGGAETLAAVLGAHVDIAVSAPDEAFPLVESGKVRPLIVFGSKRSPLIPGVRTLREVGLDFYMDNLKGLVAPKGTPAPVVAKLHDSLRRMTEDAGFRESLAKVKLELAYMNGEEFGRAMRFMHDLIGSAVK